MKNRAAVLGAAILLAAAVAVPVRGQVSAATVPGPAATTSKVLVIPFLTLNVGADQQWIGKAVEETMVADLGRTPNYSPVSFSGQTIVEDNGSAARIARAASIPFVVRGAAQEVNGDIRLTAQLIDAQSGDTVTTAIVTGPANSLLKLEDQLAAQITGQPASPATTALKAPAPPVAPQAPLAPATTTPQEAYIPPPTIVYNPTPTYTPTYTPVEPVYQSYPAYTQPDYSYVTPVYAPSYDYCAPSYSGIYFYSSPSYYRSRPRFYGGGGGHYGGGYGGIRFGGGHGGGMHSGGGYGGGGTHFGGGGSSGGTHFGGGGSSGGAHFGGGSHGGGRR